MPFSRKFKQSMGIPNEGGTLDGFTVESVSVNHVWITGSKPRRYEYPTEIVVKGKDSVQDLKSVFAQLFCQKTVEILSGYGNPYKCSMGEPEISEIGADRFLIRAQGLCTRAETGQGNMENEDYLKEIAMKVYKAMFLDQTSVDASGSIYPIQRTSRVDVRLVKIGGYSFIEQNPKKSSAWGEKAREGHKIMWICKGPRYVARVMDDRFMFLRKRSKTQT